MSERQGVLSNSYILRFYSKITKIQSCSENHSGGFSGSYMIPIVNKYL